MTGKPWTMDDVRAFNKFIEARGGSLINVAITFNGNYIFTIKLPQGSDLGWGQEMMKKFRGSHEQS